MSTVVSTQKNGIMLCCEYKRLGEDIGLTIYGGDTPHVGCVVIAEPRKSLTGDGRSATSSVINRIGHKDEAVARRVAEEIASECGRVVSCVCGIHISDADATDIATVTELAEDIVKQLRSLITNGECSASPGRG